MSGNASRTDVKLEIDRRWKTEKKNIFVRQVSTYWNFLLTHRENKFWLRFQRSDQSVDINNSVPSTSKPMESYSKDPNNNEILYNSSINNNISALLKKTL